MKRKRGSKGGDGKAELGKKFRRWVRTSGSKCSCCQAGESISIDSFRSLILTGGRKTWGKRRK